MEKILKIAFSVLLYGAILFILALIILAILEGVRPLQNDLPPNDIISSGYKLLAFGSQNSDGIELYELKGGKITAFLIPKNKNVRYIKPVVGKSGKGYCIKEENTFDIGKKTDQIIAFNLNTFKHQPTKTIIRQRYAKLAISPDEAKLAFIFVSAKDSVPLLGVYNPDKDRIEKTFPVDKIFYEVPIEILWKSDNKSVVMWSTLVGGPPAVEINTETGRSHQLDNFPLDFNGKYMLAMDGNKEGVYLQNLESEEKQIIVKKIVTEHSFILSRDGKFVIYGWLRGTGGFETLAIMDIKTKRKFQIKLENHPSTVLGLALW